MLGDLDDLEQHEAEQYEFDPSKLSIGPVPMASQMRKVCFVTLLWISPLSLLRGGGGGGGCSLLKGFLGGGALFFSE